MNVPEPSTPPATGPFLQFACFCEKVLEEKDGALSLIRVIDTITSTVRGVDVPETMPPLIVQTQMVVSLKAGQARGRYAVKLRPEDPSGAQLPVLETAVHLQGGKSGVNLMLHVQFAAQHEGVYWFDVLFAPGQGGEDVLLTRVPLDVVYHPERLPSRQAD